MLNKVILMGRLAAEPELKKTANGISVTTNRVACERSYAKKGEDKKTDFINIVAWRNNADFLCKYFHKGSLILIEGTLQIREYTNKDGDKRYVTEVVVEGISFTGERRDDSSSNAPVSEQSNGYSAVSANEQEYTEMPVDDDLPF